MMMFLLGGFKISLQIGKRLLRSIRVSRFDCAGETLIILVRLRVRAKRFAGGTAGAARPVLLKRGQRTSSRIQVTRLQCAADGIEVLHRLAKIVLIRRVGIIGGGDAGYIAHSLCIYFHLFELPPRGTNRFI